MLRALSGPGQSARRVGVAVLLPMPFASSLLPVLAQRRAPDPDGIAGARPVFTSLVGTVTAIGRSGSTDAGRRTGTYLRLDTGAEATTLWVGPPVPENLWDNIAEGARIAARAVRTAFQFSPALLTAPVSLSQSHRHSLMSVPDTSPPNPNIPDVSGADSASPTHTITVQTEGGGREFEAESGISLRQALRRHGHSPHNAVTDIANCGGRGHCGLCVVEILKGAPPPTQALDRTLSGMGVGRLSCLVTVDRDMTVRL